MRVDRVDETFEELSDKGIEFINEPTDMTGWGIRSVHFRDPENNLIEMWSELAKEKWDKDLQKSIKMKNNPHNNNNRCTTSQPK